MTDERRPGERGDDAPDQPGDERALDPDTEAEVRRLLGDAREAGPPPPEVVARLDEALAGLREESRGAGGEAPVVVPLRRRRVRRALIGAGAAAAVVVVAVPVTLSITGPPGDDSATSSAERGDAGAEARPDDLAQSEPAPESDRQQGAAPEGLADSDAPEPRVGLLASPPGGQRADQSAPGASGDDGAPAGGELLLSRPDFEDQVTALVDRGGLGPVPAKACGAPAKGRRIAVRYEGTLGTLRLTPRVDVVRARLYLCGDPGVARRFDVPAR